MNKPEEIRSALDSKTIAVVGASRDPTKDSHTVAAYLKSHGYKIIPVNPTTDRILEETSYKSLLDIPEEKARMIDLVGMVPVQLWLPKQIVQCSTSHVGSTFLQVSHINPSARTSVQA